MSNIILKNNIKEIITNNLYLIKIINNASKFRIILESLFFILRGFIQTLIYTVFFGSIVNEIYQKKSFVGVLQLAFVVILATCLSLIYCAWFSNFYLNRSNLKIEKYLVKIIYKQATEVDIECYDNPEFYNNFTTALSDTKKRISGLSSLLSQYAGIFFTVIYLLYIILSKDFLLCIFVIFSLIPSYISGRKKNLNNFQRYNDTLSHSRKSQYINRVTYLPGFAKDLRIYDMYEVMEHNYISSMDNTIKLTKKYNLKNFLYDYVLSFAVDAVIYVGIIAYITYKVMGNSLQIGDYFIILNAVSSMSWRIIWLVNGILRFEEFNLYIKKFMTFMQYPISKRNEKSTPFDSQSVQIEFKNVVFSYDNKKSVFNDLNLTIKNKEKVAIVGNNGVGKTTLVKLLLGLYKPQSGEIKFSNMNIQKYDLDSYRNLFSNVFQDINIYAFTIGENVAMDNIHTEMEDKIVQTLNKSRLLEKMNQFENGIYNNMTREFDNKGFVPSGGEAQRLIIARSIFKDSKIIIWDEPSSALDPISEKEINDLVLEVAKDKTLILISHRLSTIVNFDKIFVVDQGRIIEEGSHESLMKMNGMYADMFNKQAKAYVEGIL